VTQQARNLSDALADIAGRVQFVIRDRDTKFGPQFDTVFVADGAQVIHTPVRAPNANAVAERFVRTVRAECTDRLLIINERHLRRVLDRYVRHHNQHRPHRSLQLRAPQPRAGQGSGAARTVTRRTVVDGLINEYAIAAR
jgi:transposase InsO family protein